jgi:capsular exopolysaccharide synthesis family protein
MRQQQRDDEQSQSRPVIEDLELIARSDSGWSEGIRLLAARVRQGIQQHNRRVLMITSSWEGEGKSTVAANLAVALAQLGCPTTLVDADLRRPTLSAIFGSYAPGLADVLLREQPLSVHPTAVDRLHFVPSGDCGSHSAADVLSSGRLAAAIEELRRLAECTVIDTPPMSACKDSHLVGAVCDGALIVVRADKFVGVPEGNHSEDLRDSGIHIVGSVLNASKEATHGSAGKRGARRWSLASWFR